MFGRGFDSLHLHQFYLLTLIHFTMKTFIIMIMFFNGGTTTLSYQGYDKEEAYEYAESMCSRFDTVNIYSC